MDLVKYYYSHGTDEEERGFVEFLIPVDILPPSKINKKMFGEYQGTIKPLEVRIVKDSIGLFDKQEVSPYYLLRLHKTF